MNIELTGRRAIVLAASRGLGRAIAEAFAAAGAQLAICSRDEAVIDVLAAELAGEHGSEPFAAAANVADKDSLESFIRAAANHMGGLDILVTNAGGPAAGEFEQLDEGAWATAFELTLMSVVRAVKVALPFMKRSRGGSILSIVSSSVKVPIPSLILSNVFRPGIVGLAKSLSQELAAYGICVNTLAPGRIDTQRLREIDEVHAERAGEAVEDVVQRWESTIPLGRYGRPEELANAALFLVSDVARYITGQTIFIDGGLTPTLY